MRKIIVLTFVTLDGVMQAPGGPEEDRDGEFAYGGWTAPYSDEVFDEAMTRDMQTTDYLLGRKTFEIWEDYWPQHGDMWPGINEGTKYVLSGTRETSDWQHTHFLKDVEEIQKLKDSTGPDIQVWGSSQLIQLLLTHDLVDELRLKTYPLTLGQGKKLFGDGTIPAAFTLIEHTVTPSGVVFATYRRAGDVVTGTVG